ncbi:MAG: D-threo-aldose 1-dehydrogenase [Thermoleophilaceae bacterium]|jgi:aryl-alcohol dehydrogenase-like predicted oxidoreductase|nr:D-threo-aldose 1-dehydrogenase [Thermoleophilaceae bacterium]
METVALPGTDLAPTRLGFGSAALMARLGRRESVRLLEVAHDSGITHFDTARAYGYGEAEAALGEFLARRRDAVTVTTKLGILPPRRSRALDLGKAAARVAARRVPAVRPLLRRRAQSMGAAGSFDPATARASLDTSLSELGTDVVDFLLLHECRPEDLRTDGLLEFLEQTVREGKVRHFGVATDRDSTGAVLRERPEFAGVVQVRQTAVDPPLAQLGAPAGVPIFTHSAVAPLIAPLTEAMRDSERRERWTAVVGLDCGRPEVLGRLLLESALRANPDGVVLFSSTDEARIRANAGLADRQQLSPEELERFNGLVRETLSAG